MSTRGTILTNLRTQLLTILTTGGYASNVREVLHDEDSHDEVPTEGVSLVIIDGEPDSLIGYFESSKALHEMNVTVKARIIASGLDETGINASTGVDNIIGDMRKLIDAPISLGSNVRYTQIGDIPAPYKSKERGEVVFPIKIVYHWTRTAP